MLGELRRIATAGRGAEIRILVQDPDTALRDGAPLLALAQRLSSAVQIRTPDQDGEQAFAGAYVINDQAGLLFRPIGSRFEHSLYQALLGGTWTIRQGPGEGGLVLFHADGRVEGLPASERFALCLAGDCAAMSGEHDSLWLQQGAEGRPWLFSLEDSKLQIYVAMNRAHPDEMPDLHPGEVHWVLERQ